MRKGTRLNQNRETGPSSTRGPRAGHVASKVGGLIRKFFRTPEANEPKVASSEESARLLSTLAAKAGFGSVDLGHELRSGGLGSRGELTRKGHELIAAHAKIGVLPNSGPNGRPMIVRLRPAVATRMEDGNAAPDSPVLELLVADKDPKERQRHQPLPCYRTTVRQQADGSPSTVVAREFGWVYPPDANGVGRPFIPAQAPGQSLDQSVLPERAPTMTAAELTFLEEHLMGTVWLPQPSSGVHAAFQLKG